MDLEELKTETESKIKELLKGNYGPHASFEFLMGDVLNDDDECPCIDCEVIYKNGNVEHKCYLIVSWNEEDGIGFEYGEDGDLMEITKSNLFQWLYYDLATKDLEEQYQIC